MTNEVAVSQRAIRTSVRAVKTFTGTSRIPRKFFGEDAAAATSPPAQIIVLFVLRLANYGP